MCKGVAWSCPIDQGPALGQRDSLGDQRSGAVQGGAGVCEAAGLALCLATCSWSQDGSPETQGTGVGRLG